MKPPFNVLLDAGHRQINEQFANARAPMALRNSLGIQPSFKRAVLAAGQQCSTPGSGITLLKGNCFAYFLQLDLAIRRQRIPPIGLRYQLNQLLNVLAHMTSGQVTFKRSQ